jgi:hypothetical protein
MRVLQTHALPLGYRAQTLSDRRLPRLTQNKKSTCQLSGGGSLSRPKLNLDFYPFSLPAPEITRVLHVQPQHIRALPCALIIMNPG